ncbi:hypothetical protein VM1G_07430 [Cytospora mali]|uniref:Uncharacterized protein n=1 Tax=Cytospora mali TaxID=578113 RepID=A0A194W6N0_CYTMA|nr:hypothetical protein VM1G_07430 [Valsa mali]
MPMSKVSHPFRLLDLPGEIRNMIYREALGEPPPWSVGSKSFEFDHVQPPLARVNRQVRVESLAVYYGENTLCVQVRSMEDHSRTISKITQVESDEESDEELMFGKENDEEQLSRFRRMFANLLAGVAEPSGVNGLQFMKKLDVVCFCHLKGSSLPNHATIHQFQPNTPKEKN